MYLIIHTKTNKSNEIHPIPFQLLIFKGTKKTQLFKAGF